MSDVNYVNKEYQKQSHLNIGKKTRQKEISLKHR